MSTINPNFSNNSIQPQSQPSAPAAPKAETSKGADDRVELQGSNYKGLDKFQKLGALRSETASPISVSVYLKPNDGQASEAGGGSEIANVEKFAKANGLEVSSVDKDTNVVKLTGSAGEYQKAFGVQLEEFKDHQGQTFHAYEGNLKLPSNLAGSVQTVVGLNNLSIATPHTTAFLADGSDSKAPSGGYNPALLAKAADFPTNTDGKGQNITYVELGGGFQQADLNKYFQKQIGQAGPTVENINVDGAKNTPEGSLNGADGEVYLDLEVGGAISPGAHHAVAWAPNSAQGFIDGINEAAQRQIKSGAPGAVSISWGASEGAAFSAADMNAMKSRTDAANAKGVNFYVASGDNGSVDGSPDGKDHVDFPSALPSVTSVGGTLTEVSADGKTISQSGWDGSGGGFSNVFPEPDFQKNAGIKVPSTIDPAGGRGVPDFAFNASPESGYAVQGEKQAGSIGGTSGAAPMAAALDARLRQAAGGNIGAINPTIYAHPEDFSKITEGNNGTYSANADGSWNAVTGLGVPDGQKLADTLKGKVAAENANPSA